jgi:galactoside O-acetyltransferase
VVLRGSVLIGAHAIVGANAVVLPDITIGEGATIGAGAVVTRDVEPWSVYAGVPARKIKDRRADRIRELEQALLLEEGMPSIVFRDRSVLQALFRS